MNLTFILTLSFRLLIFLLILFSHSTYFAQVEHPYNRGALSLGQILKRLQTTASILHIGAHPDDEDSALIAHLARGNAARVGYLSLNRGEGGQNLIGDELFESLGVIRTEELLQARAIDGGDQFFTRVIDFGFTKTIEEASAKWGEERVLEDIVRIIRKYRPLIIISRFKGTAEDGHGQHRLAGYLAPKAFYMAADPTKFPEQIKEGLSPWRAFKLYVNEKLNNNKDALQVNTGLYDPLSGYTYFQLAMQGRSQHKSQEMGALQLNGSQVSSLIRLDNNRPNKEEKDIFEDIDISITGISKLTGIEDDRFKTILKSIEKEAKEALTTYSVLSPETIISPLNKGLHHTRAARQMLPNLNIDNRSRNEANLLLERKESEFTEALKQAIGLKLEVLSNTDRVVTNETLNITVNSFSPHESKIAIDDLKLHVPDGWKIEPISQNTNEKSVTERPFYSSHFNITVPTDQPLTEPYWLASPHNDKYLYQWGANSFNGAPFAPPLIKAELRLKIDEGESISIIQPVQYRYADPIRGEVRRDLNVVPALSVAIEPELIIHSTSSDIDKDLTAKLVNNLNRDIAGSIKLIIPTEWHAEPREVPFAIKKGEQTTKPLKLSIPNGLSPGTYKIGVEAIVGEERFTQTQKRIAYPHIQTHYLYNTAETTIQALDLKVEPVKVGYIMGSGDRVPDAIRRMGLEVVMLDEKQLSTGDLSRFDTIVVGIRASQVRPDFVANNNRLLEFVRNGGTLIVQYQRPDYVERNLAPLPAKIGPRVTDEAAKVNILAPNHPLFNYPNKITSADWDNWVQERTLYNFTEFDPRYTPLLESHDPNEQSQNGGQVLLKLGRGEYIYTSYAWFRQLPAGVPGAYRLFANLLSLPRTRSQ
jgi:LmbE family N-acetylglucosaminyl deacetylase